MACCPLSSVPAAPAAPLHLLHPLHPLHPEMAAEVSQKPIISPAGCAGLILQQVRSST